MFEKDLLAGQNRLKDAIRFRQKGSGYWYPDTLDDRNAISLTKVAFHPVESEDEILAMFSGKAWVQFCTPPLLRKQEQQTSIAKIKQLIEQGNQLGEILTDLEQYPSTQVLNKAAAIIDSFPPC